MYDDKAGNRKSCKIDDLEAYVYNYDKLYQLTFVDYNDGNSTNYYYDSLGNSTKLTNGGTTNYSHNSLNQYDAVGPVGSETPYSYDRNGNLTDDGTYLYYYDCENRLTDVNDQSDNPVVSYKYDFAGRRVKKTIHDSQTTIHYTYDGGQVIAEYDGDGVLLRKFVYGPGIDEPIAMANYAGGFAIYYYHYDGLGSVVALSDSNANIVEKYEYDVFGAATIRDTNDAIRNTSLYGNPYMFTGRRYDSETGLYYYRFRYYNPEIGRFLQTDPIRYAAGLNLYTYVLNNPVNWVDPYGLLYERIWDDPAERGGHIDNAVHYKKFVSHATRKTLAELQNEAGSGRRRSASSAPGPAGKYRYVIDPANPSQVIDMRHFLVVGPKGENFGLAVEIAQLRGDRQSAFDAQDFFSNKLGKDFYKNYYKKYPHLPLNVLLNFYFRDREMQRKKGS